MKKILHPVFLAFLLMGAIGLNAQVYNATCMQAAFSLQNVSNSAPLQFDLYVQSTTDALDPCHSIYMQTGDAWINFNSAAFSNPTLSAITWPAAYPTLQFFTSLASNSSDVGLNYNILPFGLGPIIMGTPIYLGTFQIAGWDGSTDPGLEFDMTASTPPPVNGGNTTLVNDPQVTQLFGYDPVNQVSHPVTIVDPPLSAELIHFGANKFGRSSSLLHWQTASEDNVSHFEIQRSEVDDRWDYVGAVEAKGNSVSQMSYEYTDRDVYDGSRDRTEFKYRLKIVDRDDSYEYSNIDVVRFNAEGEISIYPNPASNGLHLEFPVLPADQPSHIVMYDELGRLVFNTKIDSETAYEYIDFSKHNILSGVYVVKIESSDAIIMQDKVIVQRNQ